MRIETANVIGAGLAVAERVVHLSVLPQVEGTDGTGGTGGGGGADPLERPDPSKKSAWRRLFGWGSDA